MQWIMPWWLPSPKWLLKKPIEKDHVEPSIEVDQREIIHNGLQEVVNLKITIGELKEAPFVPSEHIYHAKSTLFTLRSILQIGQSAIAQERIKNNRQMTLFVFVRK